jgi:hypothetical protein
VTLAPITLVGADVDEDGVVDRADVALVIANFGLTRPPADSARDLNGDLVVNIYDLALSAPMVSRKGLSSPSSHSVEPSS